MSDEARSYLVTLLAGLLMGWLLAGGQMPEVRLP